MITYSVEITDIRTGIISGEDFTTAAAAIKDAINECAHMTPDEIKDYDVDVFAYKLDKNGDVVASACIWTSQQHVIDG